MMCIHLLTFSCSWKANIGHLIVIHWAESWPLMTGHSVLEGSNGMWTKNTSQRSLEQIASANTQSFALSYTWFSPLDLWCVPVMPMFISFSLFLVLSLAFPFCVHVTSGAQFEWLHWAWRGSLESISLMQTASPQSSLSLSLSLTLDSHEKSKRRLKEKKTTLKSIK